MAYQDKTALDHPGRDVNTVQAEEAVSPNPKSPKSSRNLPKEYSRQKLILGLSQSILFFLFALAVLLTGISVDFERMAFEVSAHPYGALLVFALIFGISEGLLTIPLRWYSGYALEHRYGLSNQSIGRWMWESLKGSVVSMILAVPVLLALYYALRTFGSLWWFPLGVALFFFSVLLSRIAPVLIFPLFYKFKPLQEGELKVRILELARKVGMRVEGVFVFDMSKNTKKANAAFTGIGKSKRIILGDTLVSNFTDDEIETIFAHELGHFKLRHIWIMMATGMVTVFLGLAIAAQVYDASLGWFGFNSIDRIAALPLLGIWLGIYSLVTSPLSNIFSRAMERSADAFAIRLTSNAEAFVSALQKLAKVNLADPNPHPVVEFLFHSHPSIQKRIEIIRHNSSGNPQ